MQQSANGSLIVATLRRMHSAIWQPDLARGNDSPLTERQGDCQRNLLLSRLLYLFVSSAPQISLSLSLSQPAKSAALTKRSLVIPWRVCQQITTVTITRHHAVGHCIALDVTSAKYVIQVGPQYHGRRNRGWGVGDNVPHFWDQRGTGGGPMKMIFVSTADSLYSVLYK